MFYHRLFHLIAFFSIFCKAFVPNRIVSKRIPNFIEKRRKFVSDDCTQLNYMITETDISEKLYLKEKKEIPKVLGGIKIGLRKLVVVTGASSGLGLKCASELAKSGNYFVVMACRNVEKGKQSAKDNNIPSGSYTVMKLELANLQSVRDFVKNLKAFKSARPLTHLVCNAAVYKPSDPNPAWTDDGFEMSVGVNHLGHFLLVNLLLEDLSRGKGARVCIVGSVTGNTNTIAGAFVYPRADLGNLKGMDEGMKKPVAMIDGKPFFGAKAYKDSKVCNMMTMLELHRRYHNTTGIVFSSLYPGCIAESALFREKRQWFRKLFPLFMKRVTGGYVGENEAGERLANVIDDPEFSKSGAYWSWTGDKGSGGSGGEAYENQLSDAINDPYIARRVWESSAKAVGLTSTETFEDIDSEYC
jgi:protochlorophyllide reductase